MFPSEASIDSLRAARGVIISGRAQPGVTTQSVAQRWMRRCSRHSRSVLLWPATDLALAGRRRSAKGDKGEFGLAFLDLQVRDSRLLEGLTDHQRVWMSHRDLVVTPPAGFRVLASTTTCPTAAIENVSHNIYAVQFHPEVVHTTEEPRLSCFFFKICGCEKDWNPANRIARWRSRFASAGERSRHFFVNRRCRIRHWHSRFCLQALRSDITGVYVDTGLVRRRRDGFRAGDVRRELGGAWRGEH